ncbi:hypothetical protein ACFWXH_29300 [Mesorhizobium sp. NPDC059054]|uniref:hypothetical protein n=1 Tax=Mesorhizobium sp. NPDC059054 TaxID=3346711 RepID=UPI003694D9A8
MKTIMAAAIASLVLSSASFAAAPVVQHETPKATAQHKGTILLAAGGLKTSGKASTTSKGMGLSKGRSACACG